MPLVPTGPWIPADIFLGEEQQREITGGDTRDTVGDQLFDAMFQRQEDFHPALGDEDDVDLPGGSFAHPLGDPNFQGTDRRPFNGRLEQWLQRNPVQALGGLLTTAVVLILGFLLLQSVAEGIGQGLAQ